MARSSLGGKRVAVVQSHGIPSPQMQPSSSSVSIRKASNPRRRRVFWPRRGPARLTGARSAGPCRPTAGD